MEHLVDARGMRCPMPYVKARVALEALSPEDVLVVLATDPEAPVDVGALAADVGRSFTCDRVGDAWRIVIGCVVAPPER